MVGGKKFKDRVISEVEITSNNDINIYVSNMNTDIDITNGLDTNTLITDTDIDNQYIDTDAR